MGTLSKACGPCKKKKVKCDEGRPKCLRCCKGGIACTPSPQRLRFVDEKPRIRRSIEVCHTQVQQFSTLKHSHFPVFQSSKIRQSQSLHSAQLSPYKLNLTAFKDDILMTYLLAKLFEGRPLNAPREILCGGLPIAWIPELLKPSQNGRHMSWDALAAICFGQAYNSKEIIREAFKLYGQALPELRNRLESPDERRSDSTLASMTALYMYEMLVSTTEKGWMSHADGLGWLLQWRGPKLQKAYAKKSIFLEHRMMLVAKSIISRQSTFLRDSCWRNVPWEDNPTSKLATDYLVDIATDVAEYLAELKPYCARSINQKHQYPSLRSQIIASLGQLNNWWVHWEAEHPQPAVEVPSTQISSDPFFLALLEYDSLWTALTVSIYNSIRILLLQLWDAVRSVPHPDDGAGEPVILDKPNNTVLLGITSDTRGLALEILQSLQYSYGKSRRFISTFTFLFVQGVAYGCFDLHSREALWIAEQGWADFVKDDDFEDANLLRRLLPVSPIRAVLP